MPFAVVRPSVILKIFCSLERFSFQPKGGKLPARSATPNIVDRFLNQRQQYKKNVSQSLILIRSQIYIMNFYVSLSRF